MAHISYGYTIIKGAAVIDKQRAEQVKDIFTAYLSGLGLRAIADKVQLNCNHTQIARMLADKHYLGDDFYPVIISQDSWDAAGRKRIEKAVRLGREKGFKEERKQSVFTGFVFCGTCGGEYRKYRVNGKDRWACSKHIVQKRVLCESPITTEEELEEIFLTALSRMDITELMKKPQEDANVIEETRFNTPFARAEYLYSRLKVEDFDYQTNKLLAIFKNTPINFDLDFMSQIIKRITIAEDKVVTFEYRNGKKQREEMHSDERKDRIRHTSKDSV